MELSIITASKNRPKEIKRLISSLIKFDGINYEHIVIDGSDDDSTKQLLKSLGYQSTQSQHHKRYISKSDSGAYFAMNKGLELARGRYVIFLNDDDFPEYCDVNALKRLFNANIPVIISRISYVSTREGPHTLATSVFNPVTVTREDLIFDRSLRRMPPPSTFILLDLCPRFNCSFKLIADYQFAIEVLTQIDAAMPFYGYETCMIRSKNQLSYLLKDRRETELIEFFSANPEYKKTFLSLGILLRFLIWVSKNIISSRRFF